MGVMIGLGQGGLHSVSASSFCCILLAMNTVEEDMTAVNASRYKLVAVLDNFTAELAAVDTALTNIKANNGCVASCQAVNQVVLKWRIDKNNVSWKEHSIQS